MKRGETVEGRRTAQEVLEMQGGTRVPTPVEKVSQTSIQELLEQFLRENAAKAAEVEEKRQESVLYPPWPAKWPVGRPRGPNYERNKRRASRADHLHPVYGSKHPRRRRKLWREQKRAYRAKAAVRAANAERMMSFSGKYDRLAGYARSKKIPFSLSYAEYVLLWLEFYKRTGISPAEKTDTAKMRYMVRRIDPAGGFSAGNVHVWDQVDGVSVCRLADAPS